MKNQDKTQLVPKLTRVNLKQSFIVFSSHALNSLTDKLLKSGPFFCLMAASCVLSVQ